MYMPIYCFLGMADVSNVPSFSEYVNWILSRKHYGKRFRRVRKMIKAFTLGLIMGAVLGVLFGVLFMAVLMAGKDDENG